MLYCRENVLRAIRFEKPAAIPMVFHINPACWNHYPREQLDELVQSHSDIVSIDSKMPLKAYPIYSRADCPFRDGWGCIWRTTEDGIVGTVVDHPLRNWDGFRNFKSPNPEIDSGRGPVEWNKIAKRMASEKQNQMIATGGLNHGHTFLTLCDIRGYENLMFDMADKETRLWQLIEMVEEFNLEIVKRTIASGVEMMVYPEDLGMQYGPMISPDHFKKYIKPSYERIIAPARNAGCIIHMHSDGDIRDLADDIIGSGVDVINLQDTVNGIEWIKEKFFGKTCVEIDIDRQNVTRFGTPAKIDDFIKNEVKTLGSKQGGLMFIYGLYPGVPIENLKAIMDAMQKYATMFS